MFKRAGYSVYTLSRNCSNSNIGIKTEPVAVGADATVYVWFLGQIYVHRPLQP